MEKKELVQSQRPASEQAVGIQKKPGWIGLKCYPARIGPIGMIFLTPNQLCRTSIHAHNLCMSLDSIGVPLKRRTVQISHPPYMINRKKGE